MKEKGFTLVELLIVLALIAVLAAILIVIIKPGQIFIRARDSQRIGDLRNLQSAIDTYLAEMAVNPGLKWTERDSCNNIFFSVSGTLPPTGWPAMPSGKTASGTTSTAANGTGWLPLNFGAVPLLGLDKLPLDPRNGIQGTINGTTTVFAYSFACETDFSYELAAKLEGPTSTMANDGGNRNCDTAGSVDCLYEAGPGKASLY